MFITILSDYSLKDASKVQEACEILDNLAASAVAEEATGFDASGSGGSQIYPATERGRADLISEDEARSEAGPWDSSSPDDMSLSTGVSSIDLEEDSAACKEYDTQLESLDSEGKKAVISSIFPGVKVLDVELTLRQCKNNAGKAIEQLLNIVLLEETGSRPRGVDGFSGPHEPKQHKRTGKKTRKPLEEVETVEASRPSAAPLSKWEVANRDIEFISAQSKYPKQQITSLYHKNGASTVNTIQAILNSLSSIQLEYDDPNVDIFVAELGLEFPTIPRDQSKALAELTYPDTAAAHSLARVLSQGLEADQKSGRVKIEWRLPPSNLDSLPKSSSQPTPNSLYPENYNYAQFSNAGNAHLRSSGTSEEARALRDKYFTQATSASRKGNASNHQGAVAAYYASVGRDYDGLLRAKMSAEADQLVASQSTRNTLDLHGVSVKDALRISREKVNVWWLGRSGGGGVREGYRIITGLGRHSVGLAKLGPAVGRMLIREGWKVEAGAGNLLVTGMSTGR